MKIKPSVASSVAALMFLAPITGMPANPTAQVFIDGGELNYIGSLSAEANQRAFALYEAAQIKPAMVSIKSKGGVTRDGIALGRWIHARQLAVKVLEYCFSSCANYVFTAASRKLVSNFAVIGFHGGLSSTLFQLDAETEAMLSRLAPDVQRAARTDMENSIRTNLATQAEEERGFFTLIGVQQRITTLGQERQAALGEREKSIGWTYNQAGFSRFGVDHIEVMNPPWNPRFINADATVTLIDVQ